jgi:hypothetical protein
MRSESSTEFPDCRRRSARDEVVLAGSAFGLSRSRSVIVSDLSEQGARIDAHDLPMPGEDMVLVVGPLDTMGKVVWRSPDRCGVQFDEAVEHDMLTKVKEEAGWISVAGWYR